MEGTGAIVLNRWCWSPYVSNLLATWIQVKGLNPLLLKTHSEQGPVSAVGGVKINTIPICSPQRVCNLVGLSLSFLIC